MFPIVSKHVVMLQMIWDYHSAAQGTRLQARPILEKGATHTRVEDMPAWLIMEQEEQQSK